MGYAISNQALTDVKDAYLEDRESVPPQDLVDYAKALSPASWKILADLYEAGTDPDLRLRILAFFQEAGGSDLHELIPLALDSRPQLSREIINIIGRSTDRRRISHLAAFLRSSRKSLKLETVRALAGLDEPAAQSLLIKLLGDEDEEIRIEAASGLKLQGNPEAAGHVVQYVSTKEFRNKSPKEIQILLACLGRSGADEACIFLKKLVGTRKITFDRRRLEMRLGAVSTLEFMGSQDAVEALEEGARSRNRKIRDACLASLRAISRKREGPTSSPGRRPA